jgi:SAM-dependent methyltransferase
MLPESMPGAGNPAAWLVAHAHLLPRSGTALDIACGRGRHALWLAGRGLRVRALDRERTVLGALAEEARVRGLPVDTELLDLEAVGGVIRPLSADVIVVVHYLHRPLLPELVAALRPGGVLVYETFTLAQASRGKPTNPDYLLTPGELRRLVAPLTVLAEREGDFDGRLVASIVARHDERS